MSLPGPSSPLQGQSVASAFPLQEQAAAPIAQGQPTAIQPGRSTLTPAEGEGAAVGGGCCTALCNLIANVIAALCNFLSGLPLIGSWFATPPEEPEMTVPEMTVPEMTARINAIYHIIGKGEASNQLLNEALQHLRPSIVQMLQDLPSTSQPEALLDGLNDEIIVINRRLVAAVGDDPDLRQRYIREVDLPRWTQALELYRRQKGLEPADINAYCDVVARIFATNQLTKDSGLSPEITQRMKQEVRKRLRPTILRELYDLQSRGLAQFSRPASSMEEFERYCSSTSSLVENCKNLLPENVRTRTLFYQRVLFLISQEALRNVPTWKSIETIENALDEIEALKVPQQQQVLRTAFSTVIGALSAMGEQVGIIQLKNETDGNETDGHFDDRVRKESRKNSVHWEIYLRTVELPYWQTVQNLMDKARHPSSASESSG